ncbi:MAG TPA: hypothetical protein VLV18_06280 [Terriglobales bacterium]|nr:hypothetical protein [Terriglobales bacterium]
MKINSCRLITRIWYYFRLGYSNYLSFPLGVGETVVVFYVLLITRIPLLLKVFPTFLTFMFLFIICGTPISVTIGWLYMKRTLLYSSEADINIESNPYSFKLTPGYQTEVMFPMMLEQLRLLRRVAADKLTRTEMNRLDELEKKTEVLLAGGYVGNPKRVRNF